MARKWVKLADLPKDWIVTSGRDFDPDEPRDDDGKWTDEGGGGGGGESESTTPPREEVQPEKRPRSEFKATTKPHEHTGYEFVSPNVASDLDFHGAVEAIGSQQQRSLRDASVYINGSLGVKAKEYNIVGAWADGAENSVMDVVQDADWSKLELSGAMKGYIADQKQVLIFQQQDGGESAMYKFEAKGSLADIHKALLEDGIAFHTLVPTKGGAAVYVADLDGTAADAVAKGAERYDAQVEVEFGRAEFLGTTKQDGTDREQRDSARKSYEAVIEKSKVQGSQEVWARVRDRWGQGLTPQESGSARSMSMSNVKPKGWGVGSRDTRFADVAPSSYDKKTRTVQCVISMGSPVNRFYGTEKLRISSDAVILDRMKSSGIPLLDSHEQRGIDNALGRFTRTWFDKRGGQPALMGEIVFNDTERGRLAEGMVARGEIMGISAGYTVREWEISDEKGNVIDPEVHRINFDDDLTFTATRWELLEGSLVSVPADSSAMIRSFGTGVDRQLPAIDALARGAVRITKRFGDASVTYEYPEAREAQTNNKHEDVRARMQARQRMYDRMRT